MKVSLNIVKQLTGLELPPTDELVRRVNEQLGGVEAVIDVNARYKDARIVRVVQCEKHPNADRLSVTKIDDGGVVNDIPRDENGYVQVVCGAPNVRADMWAIWLPPRATVPASFDDAEPFVLSARELRGILSQGMLAAADELAIGSDHNGIIAITENDLQDSTLQLKAGASFADTFGLNDTVIEIENKMFTHRPDCFGQMGVAREIAAILGGASVSSEKLSEDNDTRYQNPDWYWKYPQFSSATGLELTVKNEAPEKVPRLMAVAMQNVAIQPSPLWLQCALVAMGSKPINNVVDVTNYLMLMTAQPTHAYDYDKLRGHTLAARMAKNGEKLHLLNDKTYELTGDDIVIADADGAVGLAGIMGGGDSEVDATTKNIVLEVATFNMYTVRKTSMRHGVFTDALTRFNKGQSPLQNDRVLSRLMTLMSEFAGAKQASDVFDEPQKDWAQYNASLCVEMRVSVQFVNDRLGSNLTADQIGNLLRGANFALYPPDDDTTALLVTAPFWRTDIEMPEDIVEEVGRLYGFDKLPRALPNRSITPAPRNARRVLKQRIREILARAGANETLNYSFIHERVLKNAALDAKKAYKINNALSPSLQYYRLNVLPSLLDKVHANIKAGYDEFTLFEIGKGHDKTLPLNNEQLPVERNFVDAVYASKKSQQGAAYFHAQRMVTWLFDELSIKYTLSKITDEKMDDSPFELTRTARIIADDGTVLGMVGELKAVVKQSFKLPDYTAAFSLDIDEIEKYIAANSDYQPLSRYPSTHRDITLQAASDVPYKTIADGVTKAVEAYKNTLAIAIEPKSIYQANDDTTHTATTFHLTFTSFEHTLTDADIEPVMTSIDKTLHDTCGAVRV